MVKTSKVAVTLTHHLAWASSYPYICVLVIAQASSCTKLTCMSHYITKQCLCTGICSSTLSSLYSLLEQYECRPAQFCNSYSSGFTKKTMFKCKQSSKISCKAQEDDQFSVEGGRDDPNTPYTLKCKKRYTFTICIL